MKPRKDFAAGRRNAVLKLKELTEAIERLEAIVATAIDSIESLQQQIDYLKANAILLEGEEDDENDRHPLIGDD